MEMQSSSFVSNLTVSNEFTDHSYDKRLIQKISEKDDIQKYSSANITRHTSAVSTSSNETDVNENSITKRLLLHRSNTTPFKTGSKFKPTVFIKYKNYQTKVDDTKEIFELLRTSFHAPMNFPPIVVEQLKKHGHDPYINNVRFFLIGGRVTSV
jgi:hypothetical protein